MGLIFPVCLIYTPVTETLFKEILMKKEEEELILAEYQPKHSRCSPLQGMEWLCTGMMERLMLQQTFLRTFPVSATFLILSLSLWKLHRKATTKTLPVPYPTSALPFLSGPLLEKPGQPLPSLELTDFVLNPCLGGCPHASSSERCACRQLLSTVNAVELWLLGGSSQSASGTTFGSRQQPCPYTVFPWSFSTLFLFLLLY